MGIIFPTAYQGRHLTAKDELVKWSPSTGFIVKSSDGGLYNYIGGNYTRAIGQQYWNGGYAYIKGIVAEDWSKMGITDEAGWVDTSNSARNRFTYGLRRGGGNWDVIINGGMSFNIASPKSANGRIVLDPASSTVYFQDYDGNNNEWRTFWTASDQYLYDGNGNPKKQYPFYTSSNTGRSSPPNNYFPVYVFSSDDMGFVEGGDNFETRKSLERVEMFNTNFSISSVEANTLSSSLLISANSSVYDNTNIGNYRPFKLKGGKKIHKLEFSVYKDRPNGGDTTQYHIRDNNENVGIEITIGTFGNIKIEDGNNNNLTNLGGSNGIFQKIEVYFDWVNSQYLVKANGNKATGPLLDCKNVDHINFYNPTGFYDYIDDITFYDNPWIEENDHRISATPSYQTDDSDYFDSFEDQSLSAFTINDPNFEIKSNEALDGSYSVGLEETGTTVSDVAVYDPGLPEFSQTFSYARDFDVSSSNYLNGGDDIEYEMGNNEFYFCFFINLDNTGTQVILNKGDPGDDELEWSIFEANSQFEIQATPDGIVGNRTRFAWTQFSVSTGVWYFCEGAYDPNSDELKLSVTDTNSSSVNSFETGTLTGGVYQSSDDFWVGNQESTSNDIDAQIDSLLMVKGQLPTSSQRDAIFNNGNGLTSGQFKSQFSGTSFYDNVVDFFDMDGQDNEVGNINEKLLTENGTVGRVNGVAEETLDISRPYFTEIDVLNNPNPGKAAKFEGGSTNRLEAQSNDVFQISGDTFYMATWTKIKDINNYQNIIDKREGGVADEWGCYFNPNGRIYFFISTDGSNFNGVWEGFTSQDTWVFIECIRRGSSGTIEIQLNRGSISSSSASGTVYDGDFPMRVSRGGVIDVDNTLIFIGSESDLPTNTQRDEIYNNGSGIGWDMFDRKFNGTNFYNGIKGFWELEESGGTRSDSSFNNEDLNEVGSVENTQGIVNMINSGISFMNTNGDDELAIFFDEEPNLSIYNSNGTTNGLLSVNEGDWIKVKVWFDWDHYQYRLIVEQDQSDATKIEYIDTGSLVFGYDFDKVKFKNIDGVNDWTSIGGTGPMALYSDRIKINDKNL